MPQLCGPGWPGGGDGSARALGVSPPPPGGFGVLMGDLLARWAAGLDVQSQGRSLESVPGMVEDVVRLTLLRAAGASSGLSSRSRG